MTSAELQTYTPGQGEPKQKQRQSKTTPIEAELESNPNRASLGNPQLNPMIAKQPIPHI
jgi:hypothetical protein